MFIFGTIGLFVRNIPLPSSVIALVRGVIGTLFLIVFTKLKKEKISITSIKKNALTLILSGAAIGVNWILFFESYRYTTVAAATLCYYFAPIFVILLAPVFYKEKLTAKKIVCAVCALVGMFFVSGVTKTSVDAQNIRGMALALGAAVLYASVMLLNKRLSDISAYERTIAQLAVASAVLIPYVLMAERLPSLSVNGWGIVLLLIVGVIHTGMAYALYFGAMKDVPTQTTAIFSYIDPVVAVIISSVILKEHIGVMGIVGAVLILGSAVLIELPAKEKMK